MDRSLRFLENLLNHEKSLHVQEQAVFGFVSNSKPLQQFVLLKHFLLFLKN